MEDEESLAQALADPASQSRGRGRGRGAGKPAKGRGGGALKTCYVCSEKVRAHSRFCAEHHKDVEAMRYQAKQTKDPKNIEALEMALADPGKCLMALEEFSAQNPAGKFRKKLIDWASFRKKHGRRAEARERVPEELMDIDDFIKLRVDKGKSREAAIDEWKIMLTDRTVAREGVGAAVKLWVPLNKQRFVDKITYADAGLEEGSKDIKDLAESDRPAC